ncbi:Fc.00g036250.m01.CDS01 [Cosmosporella sp. VM-42]
MSNGSLCQDCHSKDEKVPISLRDAQACLLEHQSLEGKLLFRAGGLKTTQRFPDATPKDINLSIKDRSKRIAALNIPTFGPAKVIRGNLISMDWIPPFSVIVKEFTPQKGDMLNKNWVDDKGEKKTILLPPYAIADVDQYVEQTREYYDSNFKGWAKVKGGPFSVIVALLEFEKTPSAQKKLLHSLMFFIFAAYYLVGEETLGTPVIKEEGHRLNGKRIAPRMILGQQDPANTLAILIPAQEIVIGSLTGMLASEDPQNWGPTFISLAALCNMGVIMFADRKRHGKDNAIKGVFSVPEFVVGLASALTILLAKFHKFEARFGRDTGVKASDPAVKDYYNTIEPLKKSGYEMLGDEDIDVADWWLAQLAAEQGDWVPRPTPYIIDDE